MLQIIHNDGYNNVSHIIQTGGLNMLSVITFCTPEYAVIGSDGRSKNIRTGNINTDAKEKIVRYENSLIGIAGRTDFVYDGKWMEVEEILSYPHSLYPFLNEAHLQLAKDERVDLTLLTPRNIKYDGKNIKLIVYSVIQITSGKIEIVSGEGGNRICTGVKHSERMLFESPADNMKDSVIKCIKYDIQKEIENKTYNVGGRIKIFEMYADGRIIEGGV